MTNLEKEIKVFQENFPHEDFPSLLKKLGEEFGELAEAIARSNGDYDNTYLKLEIGDMGIILAGMLLLINQSLSAWMSAALEKNWSRLGR